MSNNEIEGLFKDWVGVTPFGLYCRKCKGTPIGTSPPSIRSHFMKCHSHSIVSSRANLSSMISSRLTNFSAVKDFSPFLKLYKPNGEPVEPVRSWYCHSCLCSFQNKSSAKRHSQGKCFERSVVSETICYPTTCGRLAPKHRFLVHGGDKTVPRLAAGTVDVAVTTTVSQSTKSQTVTEAAPSPPRVPASVRVEARDAQSAGSLSTITMQVIDPVTYFADTARVEVDLDRAGLIEKLGVYSREDESPADLVKMYRPLLVRRDFPVILRQYLAYMSDKSNMVAEKAVDAANIWFENGICDNAIDSLPGHVRQALATFEYGGDFTQNKRTVTFSSRQSFGALSAEIAPLLRFVLNFPTVYLDDVKGQIRDLTSREVVSHNLIPTILVRLAMQPTSDFHVMPLVCLFAMSRGFHINRDGVLKMQECGYVASKLSCVLHLLRCGVANAMSAMRTQDPLRDTILFANSVQKAAPVNIISPWIRMCRSINKEKPSSKKNRVNADGDITSDSWTFRNEMNCIAIPSLVKIARKHLSGVFSGDYFEKFMDPRLPVTIVNWANISILVKKADGTRFRSEELLLAPDYEVSLHCLADVAMFSVWALGVGATRLEEIKRLLVSRTQICDGFMYYYTKSVKRGKLGAEAAGTSEHRLSSMCTLVFLLYRVALSKAGLSTGRMDDCLFPEGIGDQQGAGPAEICRQVFKLDTTPDLLAVRHWGTSLHNILFAKSDGVLAAQGGVAHMSGHSEETHLSRYATEIEDWRSCVYETTHAYLGDGGRNQILNPIVRPAHFFRALKISYGESAAWKPGQEKMVRLVTTSSDHHVYVGAPCGGGKTLCVTLGMIAHRLAGSRLPCTLLIVPYKFLAPYVDNKIKVILFFRSAKLTLTHHLSPFTETAGSTSRVF